MLTPREKSPLPENVPRGGSNPRRCGQRADVLPTELFRPHDGVYDVVADTTQIQAHGLTSVLTEIICFRLIFSLLFIFIGNQVVVTSDVKETGKKSLKFVLQATWFSSGCDAWCNGLHVCFPCLPPTLECGFESRLGLEPSGFSMWHFLKLVARDFLRVLRFPPLLHRLMVQLINRAQINAI